MTKGYHQILSLLLRFDATISYYCFPSVGFHRSVLTTVLLLT